MCLLMTTLCDEITIGAPEGQVTRNPVRDGEMGCIQNKNIEGKHMGPYLMVENDTMVGTATDPWVETTGKDNCWVVNMMVKTYDMAWVDLKHERITRKLRKGRRARSTAFDPADWRQLDGDCYYACAYWSLRREVPSPKAIQWMRWKHIQAFKTAKDKSTVLETEHCGEQEYTLRYLRGGWGGLPELHTYVGMTGKNICVVDGQGKPFKWVCSTPGVTEVDEIWQYRNFHYRVLRRSSAKCSLKPCSRDRKLW